MEVDKRVFSLSWAHQGIVVVLFKWGLESVGQVRLGGQVNGILCRAEAWRHLWEQIIT